MVWSRSAVNTTNRVVKLNRTSIGLLGCVLVLALLFFSGCATRWQKPEVSLVDVEPAGGTLFEQRLKLRLRVRNPNDRDIPVERLHFQLVVAEKRFASGQSASPVLIPRQGEAVVDVEASLQLASLLRSLPAIKGEDGRLHYRLRGEVIVEGYGAVPFDHPGVLDLGLLEGHVRKQLRSEP